MKRLLSIMLMNAWGGLRQKASLPTMSLVGISVIALLVASTVTADASPHTNIPVVSTVASAVHTVTDPISSILSNTVPPKTVPLKSPKKQSDANSATQQPSISASNANNTPTPSNSPSNTTNSTNQPSSQPATVAIAASALQCSPNSATNSYTVNVTSAQLSFQTPPTAGGTITYAWDMLSSNGQVTLGTTSGQQQFTAGQASVTLSPSQTQYLYTTNSSTSSFSFRLHITGPFDVTSSWVSVPMSADGSCPPSNN